MDQEFHPGFYENLNNQYPKEHIKHLKDFANYNRKITTLKSQQVFLLKCRSQGLFPKNIKNGTKIFETIMDNGHCLYSDVLKAKFHTMSKILNLEIKICIENICHNETKESNSKYLIMKHFPRDIYLTFFEKQNQIGIRNRKINDNRLKSKVDKLRSDQQSINFSENNDEKAFINLTNHHIPADIQQFLGFGPKFSVPSESDDIPLINIIADTEQILKRNSTSDQQHNAMRSKVVNIMTNFIHNGRIKGHRSNFITNRQIISMYDRTKTFLKNNKEIIITSADKGKSTVAITKTEYENKMNNMLQDEETYKKSNNDPTLVLMNKNNAIVKQLIATKCIDEKTAKWLTNNNSVAPKIYGLPKTHKENHPCRPVVSNIDSACYSMAQFLSGIIKNIVDKDLNINNSYDFQKFISTKCVPHGHLMVSFDVVSLFTNVSIELVIKVIEKRWDKLSRHTSISKEKFVKMIEFCLIDCNYFMYRGQIYKQFYGTAMGNPLSAVVSTIVLDDLLETKLKELPIELPFFKKYVDDCITIVPENEVQNVLDIINSYDTRIKFTVEIENNHKICFLDMELNRDNKSGQIRTNWYTKVIASKRILHFYSHHAFKYKCNTAYNLINRVLELSHKCYHNENIGKIKDILKTNKYPLALIEKFIRDCKKNLWKKENGIPTIKVTNENSIYQSLTYVEGLSQRIDKAIRKEFPDTIIAYKNRKTLRNLFSKTKDPLVRELKSNVCYKVQCKNCDNVYIGQTGRHVKTRMAEHRRDVTPKKKNGNSSNTPRNTPNKTALKKHHETKGHTFDFENYKIIGTEKHLGKRLIMEACNIITTKNACNNRSDTENIETSYAPILRQHYRIEPQ